MIRARVQHGRLEMQDPVPDDDPLPDLEGRLAALHALGPMEFEPGEPEQLAEALAELDHLSKAAMQALARSQP